MRITIYKAQSGDIEQLQDICIKAFSQNFAHHWNEGGLAWYLDQQFSIDQLTQDLESPLTDYYLIYQDELPVGFFKIGYTDPTKPSADGNWLELEKIYVLPTQKGNGIGKLVMEFVVNIAREKANDGLVLYVIDTNQAAIRFYEKNGFSLTRRTRLELPYFKDELKGAWQMVKPL